MTTIPTTEQRLETHIKLSGMVSSRLNQFLDARRSALEALQPNGKKEPDIEAAIKALESTRSHSY